MRSQHGSKDTSSESSVLTAHVPVSSGECALVPASDLEDATRFGVWTRFYRALGPEYDLWANVAWREVAETLFRERIERAAQGDSDALALLLAELPPAISLHGVETSFNDALLRRRHEVFERLGRLLKQGVLRPAPEEARAWVRVQRRRGRALIAHALKQAWRVRRGRPEVVRSSPPLLPAREAVMRLTDGGAPEEGGEAGNLLTYHQRYKKRRRGLWRVAPLMQKCDEHRGRLDKIYQVVESDWPYTESSLKPPDAMVPMAGERPRRGKRRKAAAKQPSKSPSLPMIADLDG